MKRIEGTTGNIITRRSFIAGDDGFGNFGMDKIDVDGPDYRNHIRKYNMHSNISDHVG